jgi:DNA-binding response OmpR family regulator
MPKVLVVEDFDPYFKMIDRELSGKVEVLRAATLEEGDNLFQSNPDIDLIIMDACVPGHKPNAMPLVKKIVGTGFTKPIIACSTTWTGELLKAGATHESDKDRVAKITLELLNL